MDDADLLRALVGPGFERAVPHQPGQGADGAVDRLRPAHPDRLRPRLAVRARRGRQGRGAGRAPRAHGDAARPDPRRRDEHLDDDQRGRGVDARALRGQRRAQRRGEQAAARHHPERHREGVPEPRHLHLPAAAVAPVDRRHVRVLPGVDPVLEPHERVQLPPARGGCDAGAGDRLLARHRHRRARRGARLGPGAGRPHGQRGGVDQLLRERRHPLRGGDLQDAGLHRAVGPHLPRALRHHRRQGPPLPLRRAGQQPGPDRGPAREQRAAHRARGPRRDALERCPRPFDPAPGVERGAGPPPPVGPAVVAAHTAGAGVRDRPARVRRHLRRLARGRGQDRRTGRRVAGRARRRAGAGRGLRGHRRAEGPAGPLARRADAAHRERRPQGRRRQLLHRDGPVAARRRRQHPQGRPAGRSRAHRRGGRVALEPRQRRGEAQPGRTTPGSPIG